MERHKDKIAQVPELQEMLKINFMRQSLNIE